MLIRSPDSFSAYRPASLVDHIHENANLTEGDWRKDIGGYFLPIGNTQK